MRKFERPSILAVGLSEIFDGPGNESGNESGNDSTAEGSVVSTNRSDFLRFEPVDISGSPRIAADVEMLRWMIFSANPQASLSRFVASNVMDQQSACDDSACDDSACGMSIDGDGEGTSGEVSFIYARTAKRAIELLRIMRFDLLVTSDQLPDMAVGQLMGRIRAVRPWQKWALVMSSGSTSSEITARSMGAAAVFDAPVDLPLISDLAHAVASREPAKMAVGAGSDASDFAIEGVAARKQRVGKSRKSGSPLKSVRVNQTANRINAN